VRHSFYSPCPRRPAAPNPAPKAASSTAARWPCFTRPRRLKDCRLLQRPAAPQWRPASLAAGCPAGGLVRCGAIRRASTAAEDIVNLLAAHAPRPALCLFFPPLAQHNQGRRGQNAVRVRCGAVVSAAYRHQPPCQRAQRLLCMVRQLLLQALQLTAQVLAWGVGRRRGPTPCQARKWQTRACSVCACALK
jgi:hypothetical protein